VHELAFQTKSLVLLVLPFYSIDSLVKWICSHPACTVW